MLPSDNHVEVTRLLMELEFLARRRNAVGWLPSLTMWATTLTALLFFVLVFWGF